MLLTKIITLDTLFKPYDWFHLMWIGITMISCFLLCFFLGRKHNEIINKIVILSLGTILVISEILKQAFFRKVNGAFWDGLFPFQLCSLPMYVYIPAALFKKGKIKDALLGFLATYTFFGGIAIYLYPTTCISTSYLIICIHTMLWHCILIVLGAYIIVAYDSLNSFKQVVQSFIVFLVTVGIAIAINEIGNSFGRSFTLYFLSYKYGCEFKTNFYIIYSGEGGIIRWLVYVLCYIVGFFGIGCIEYLIINIIKKVSRSVKNENQSQIK